MRKVNDDEIRRMAAKGKGVYSLDGKKIEVPNNAKTKTKTGTKTEPSPMPASSIDANVQELARAVESMVQQWGESNRVNQETIATILSSLFQPQPLVISTTPAKVTVPKAQIVHIKEKSPSPSTAAQSWSTAELEVIEWAPDSNGVDRIKRIRLSRRS